MNKPLPPRTERDEKNLESAHRKIAEKQAQAGKTNKPVTSIGGRLRQAGKENA